MDRPTSWVMDQNIFFLICVRLVGLLQNNFYSIFFNKKIFCIFFRKATFYKGPKRKKQDTIQGIPPQLNKLLIEERTQKETKTKHTIQETTKTKTSHTSYHTRKNNKEGDGTSVH